MFRICHFLAAVVLCFLICPCSPVRAADTHTGQVPTTNHYPVFFVTDREIEQSDHGPVFNNGRSAKLIYGTAPCDVETTKKDKQAGDDLTILADENQFLTQLKQTGCPHVAIFVHGYRKSFEGSLEIAKDMASQLQEPVVLFAWPSKNKYSAYMIDECTAEWSSYHLADVLHSLGSEFGNENVRVIAHSLAARMVCWSYGILAQTNALRTPFASSLFFSPDMDRDTFLANAPLIKRASSSVKVFIDAHDSRIWLSKVLHGSPRLGTIDNSPEQPQVFQLADFDASMSCHRITPDLLTAAFRHLDPIAH